MTGAKVKLLDRLRLQTMEAQVAARRAFMACRGLGKRQLAVRPPRGVRTLWRSRTPAR